jgi:ADP-heptose:LPS heptosyltransferase
VSWYGAARPEFRSAVASLPFRFLPALPAGSRIHAIDFYLNQAGAPIGAVPRIPAPRWNGGYIAIHPFSGSAAKNWPLENYRALALRLSPLAPVKWTAGPVEPLEDAVRFDDLYELACWIAGARLFIGNDSGISHLAAAVGTPVVALFGPTDPAVWAPRGDRVRILRAEPLSALPAERVAAACEKLAAIIQ